jgi:hypothetical protein
MPSLPHFHILCVRKHSLSLFSNYVVQTLIVLYREYLFLIIFPMITKKFYVIVNSVKVMLVL